MRLTPENAQHFDKATIRVFVNDVEMPASSIVMADDEKGEVTRVIFDENGYLVVRDDEILHETIRGRVRIEGVRVDGPRS